MARIRTERGGCRYRPFAGAAIVGVVFAGCASPSPAKPITPATAAPRAFIARPCKALQQKARGTPVGMIVQVASISSPVEQPLRTWLASPAVDAHNIAGVLVEQGKPASTGWGQCTDATCSAQRDARLTVRVPTLPTDASEVAVLEMEITAPQIPAHRAVVQAKDQTPTVAALSSVAGESIIVTPYFLFDPKKESMKLLGQCISGDAQRLAAATDRSR